MPTKTIKKIYNYAQQQGYNNFHLEKRDGELVCFSGDNHILHLSKDLESEIVNLFRSLLNLSNHDFAVNKKFKILDEDQIINGKVSILPAKEGERLIINLSKIKPVIKRLSGLGLTKKQHKIIKNEINKTTGLIILSGDIENGVSSTYYSLLKSLSDKKSVYSIEDFPSHEMDNINLINPRFYGGINSVLDQLSRLDSDIVAIDVSSRNLDLKKIWQIAGGRLVILSLNESSPAQILKNFKLTGLSSQEIAQRLNLISLQKLFKRPCLKCLQTLTDDSKIKKIITKSWPIAKKAWPKKIYFNQSCSACSNEIEKSNKVAAFAFMKFNSDASLDSGYQTLIEEALDKVGLGLINIEDVVEWALEKK